MKERDEWKELKRELLSDPATRAAWEENRPRYKRARKVIGMRVAMGLTQAQLAERTGMSQAAIARLESGEIAPKWDTLARLFAAMDATVEVRAKKGRKTFTFAFTPEELARDTRPRTRKPRTKAAP